MSGHGTSRDKVIQGQAIEGPLRTPWTLHRLIDGFGQRITPTKIIAGTASILDIVAGFEPLEALHPGVIDVVGEGNKSRRRRSVGSRHFNVEDRLMVQGAMANAVVVSS